MALHRPWKNWKGGVLELRWVHPTNGMTGKTDKPYLDEPNPLPNKVEAKEDEGILIYLSSPYAIGTMLTARSDPRNSR